MTKKTYTFTKEQLYQLLSGVFDLYDEYRSVHGKNVNDARGCAVLDTIEGLDEERYLIEQGERFKPSQVLSSKGRKK